MVTKAEKKTTKKTLTRIADCAIIKAHEIRIQQIVQYTNSDYGQGMSIRKDGRA